MVRKITEKDFITKYQKSFTTAGLYKSRPEGENVNTLLFHYISALNTNPQNPFDVASVIEILKDYKYSAHFLIDRAGNIYLLVDPKYTAYHAGRSILPDTAKKVSVNDFSIGVECLGLKEGLFTIEQYESLVSLTLYLESIGYKFDYILGHQNVAGWYAVTNNLRDKNPNVKYGRKIDPGDGFRWDIYFNLLYEERITNIKIPLIKRQIELQRKVNDLSSRYKQLEHKVSNQVDAVKTTSKQSLFNILYTWVRSLLKPKGGQK